MSEFPDEFRFDEALQEFKDLNIRWLEKVRTQHQSIVAGIEDHSLPDLRENTNLDFEKEKNELEEQLARRLKELTRERDSLREMKEKSDNLGKAIDDLKTENSRSRQEISRLKLLSPLIKCYEDMFDLSFEVEEISEDVCKVFIKFSSNNDMAPVVIVLNVPERGILSSTDVGDVPLENYKGNVGKYLLYLRTKYSKAH